jgi:NitT/TauT family transport system substrate-binding protein
MSKLARVVAVWTLPAFLLSPANAIEVNFITDFGYNGRHSYFYVALDKGYYKAEGLEVNILRGQGSSDAIKKVASGAATVGFADAGALVLARSNDAIPVKLLSIVYAGPPHAIFAVADNRIKTAKDLEGKTIADSAFSSIPVIFNAFAQAAGVDREKVKWI